MVNRSRRSTQQAHRIKAHKAFEIIKTRSSTRIATRPNLYKKCLDGIEIFGSLLQRGIPEADEVPRYGTLRGQQAASLFASTMLDNVLTVLIEERTDHKWSWDIVADNGLICGSSDMRPCSSREEAEEGALGGLSMIGLPGEPSPDYVPEADPENKLQIRVNSDGYIVPKLYDSPAFNEAIIGAMKIEGTTFDGLMARFANLVLVNGVDNHPVALAMLANCGWTHVTQQILEDFCAANGVDDLETPTNP